MPYRFTGLDLHLGGVEFRFFFVCLSCLRWFFFLENQRFLHSSQRGCTGMEFMRFFFFLSLSLSLT